MPQLCPLDVLQSGKMSISEKQGTKGVTIVNHEEDYDEPSTYARAIRTIRVRSMEKISEAVTIVNDYQSEEKLDKMHCLS